MQIKLTFKVDEPFVIPLNYNYQLQSAIYSKLREVGESDFYHNVGFGAGAKFKGFVFGKLSGKYTLHNKRMRFTDTISFEVRSPVFEFCDALQRSFELNPTIKLFDSKLYLIGANLMNYHINTDSIICTTDSPVYVKVIDSNKHTIFFSPDDELFVPMLEKNYEKKYQSIYRAAPGRIKIEPLGKHKKVVTSYKDIWVTSYMGTYKISGGGDSLEFIYNVGLGEKNSQGFGMIEIK